MIALGLGIAGAAAGVVQAGLLARASSRGPHPLGLLGRLLLVAAVLLLAARAGHLLAAAGGWLLGFGVASAAVYRRLR